MELVCQCGRLKELKRCGMSLDKARAGANFIQPRIVCDEECARLERNRLLASALNVSIDPTTTNATVMAAGRRSMASSTTAPTVPYSDETLDRYLSITSSATLSTLQAYEQKLHDLAHSEAKRSTRFTPARASLRAFIHSLAADWGFSSESFDPEPHRYVEVYRSIKWLPPAPLSNHDPTAMAIGIAGISVAEGVRMRERELAKDRELKRAAAAAAAALKTKAAETATVRESSSSSIGGGGGNDTGSSSGGWAQVARKKTGPADSPYGFSMPTTLPGEPSFGKGRFGALVLKSSVGRAKGLNDARGSAKREEETKEMEVADDWEQEVDAEEIGDGKNQGGQETAENQKEK
ncbi:FKBP12-associated protein [Ascosphaera aggregata]|nr:FKBP12-associated protein [Ascosphaera aggregata]